LKSESVASSRRWHSWLIPALIGGVVVAIIGVVVVVLFVDTGTRHSSHLAGRLPSTTVTTAPETVPPSTSPAASGPGLDGSGLVPPWIPIQIDHPAPSTVALPPVLTSKSPTPGVVVTPGQAASIFNALWILRQEAFSTHNQPLMAEFETGPALESDEVTCGCNTRIARGSILDESMLVPRETSYPAAFLGEATTTLAGDHYVQYLIISRLSAASPWKVVSDPGYTGTAILDRPSGGGGFDSTSSPSVASAGRLPGALASYWQTWTDSGQPPANASFAAGDWTTKAGATMAEAPQGATDAVNGLEGYYRYQPGASDEIWSFGAAQGAITCGVVRAQTTWTSPTGTYQPVSLTNWGPSVAAGDYQAVAETSIVQPCFFQRPGEAISVVSGAMDPDTEQGIGRISITPSTTSPASVYGTPITGQLLSGESAIVAVNASGKSLTADTNSLDVRYTVCPSFHAVSSAGAPMALAALRVGDFATLKVDATVPCVSQVSLLATPEPPTCDALNSGGQIDVVWVGFNTEADSVVYTRVGQGQPTVAVHWCRPPTVIGSNGSALTLAAIPLGALVQIEFSGNVWVTGVTLKN
jgi:hypothetical protein